jgi:hypothetical protein
MELLLIDFDMSQLSVRVPFLASWLFNPQHDWRRGFQSATIMCRMETDVSTGQNRKSYSNNHAYKGFRLRIC